MRSIWTGSLNFGLINIPVRIYSASEERAIKFRLLDKHGNCPVSYLKVCRTNGKTVKYEDIVRGYEYQKGDFVILSDEELKRAAPKKTKLIQVMNFVSEDEIPEKIVNKPYYIEPDAKAEKAYVLLREALKKADKVGVAKFVLRDKEHLAIIKPEDKALMLITLRYQDELREPEKLNIPENSDFSPKELDMALMLINHLEEHFKLSDYSDTYTKEVKKLIEKKAQGKPIRIKDEKEPPMTDMRNLMQTLKLSLEREKTKTRGK
ncbi:MAG: Ku protein [Bacillota bacterium]